MIRKITIALLGLIAASAAYAGQPIYGVGPINAPGAQQIFNTGSVDCSPVGQTAVWNPAYYSPALPNPIYIKKVRIWIGASLGFRGDIAITLFATNADTDANGTQIGQRIYIDDMGWDHYSDVKGFSTEAREISWDGDYIRLYNTDSITFQWACGASTGGNIHIRIAIWYTLAP